MPNSSTRSHMSQWSAKQGRAGLCVLLDPDRTEISEIAQYASIAQECGVAAIFMGSSFLSSGKFDLAVRTCREACSLPVILFPGDHSQLSASAHAVLYLSMISGRNPELLIGEHVRSAFQVRRLGLETLSTGYMLVESGRTTSAQFMSNTQPLPADKPDIAAAHALAGELLGLQFIYMDAGSGALCPVGTGMVRAVSSVISVPLIVGGGLREPRQIQERVEAGADLIVVGTALERGGFSASYLRELVNASSCRRLIQAGAE